MATDSARRPPPAAWLLVPLALAVVAYAPALDGQFQFDDAHTVEGNLDVKELGSFRAERFVASYFASGRPVTDLTFALNYSVGRLEPWNFHLTNLALHLAAVVLAWAFVRGLLRRAGAERAEWTAVAVAGVFALHPIQSQAVAYVSQRAEVLSSAVYLGALLALLAAERRSPKAALPWLGLGFALFVIGLGAKSIVITLPATWLLVAAVAPPEPDRAGRWPLRTRLLATAPFFGFAAYYAWRTVSALATSNDAGFAVAGLTPGSYFVSEWRVLAIYLRLLVLPVGQALDWDLQASPGLSDPAALGSGLLLLAVVTFALWLLVTGRARADADGAAMRVAGVGLLWFFFILSVTSSFVPLDDLLMEHRVYLACLGPFAAAGVGVERLLARRPAGTAGAMAIAALIWALPAAATWNRAAVWKSQRALWTDAIEKAPGNPRAWMSLAYAAMTEGDLEQAVQINLKALEVARATHGRRRDQSTPVLVQILRNLGGIQLLLNRYAEAEATLREAVAIAPQNSDALNNLAATLEATGKVDEAEVYAHRASIASPLSSEPWATLGAIKVRRGDPAGAIPLLDRAVALAPDVPLRHYNRAAALLMMGRSDEACATFRALNPGADPILAPRLAEVLSRPPCAPRR